MLPATSTEGRGKRSSPTPRPSRFVPVSDLDRAAGFYKGRRLGLERGQRLRCEEPAPNPMIRYAVGDGTVLVYKSVGAGQSRHTLVGFIVDDIEATVDDLRRRGVTFEEYDMGDIKTENGIATLGDDNGRVVQGPRREHPRRRTESGSRPQPQEGGLVALDFSGRAEGAADVRPSPWRPAARRAEGFQPDEAAAGLELDLVARRLVRRPEADNDEHHLFLARLRLVVLGAFDTGCQLEVVEAERLRAERGAGASSDGSARPRAGRSFHVPSDTCTSSALKSAPTVARRALAGSTRHDYAVRDRRDSMRRPATRSHGSSSRTARLVGRALPPGSGASASLSPGRPRHRLRRPPRGRRRVRRRRSQLGRLRAAGARRVLAGGQPGRRRRLRGHGAQQAVRQRRGGRGGS